MASYSTTAGLEANAGNDAAAESLYRIACDMAASDTFSPRFKLFLSLLAHQRLADCDAMLARAQGDHATSDAMLNEIKEIVAVLACYQITQIHAFRGEADATFEWLEKCVEVRDPGVFNAKPDRLFNFVHGDARWKPLMLALGFDL